MTHANLTPHITCMPEDFANMPSAFVLKRKVHQIITAETALMDAELDAQNQENSHHA